MPSPLFVSPTLTGGDPPSVTCPPATPPPPTFVSCGRAPAAPPPPALVCFGPAPAALPPRLVSCGRAPAAPPCARASSREVTVLPPHATGNNPNDASSERRNPLTRCSRPAFVLITCTTQPPCHERGPTNAANTANIGAIWHGVAQRSAKQIMPKQPFSQFVHRIRHRE